MPRRNVDDANRPMLRLRPQRTDPIAYTDVDWNDWGRWVEENVGGDGALDFDSDEMLTPKEKIAGEEE